MTPEWFLSAVAGRLRRLRALGRLLRWGWVSVLVGLVVVLAGRVISWTFIEPAGLVFMVLGLIALAVSGWIGRPSELDSATMPAHSLRLLLTSETRSKNMNNSTTRSKLLSPLSSYLNSLSLSDMLNHSLKKISEYQSELRTEKMKVPVVFHVQDALLPNEATLTQLESVASNDGLFDMGLDLV